ncbi:MAG TPA: glucan biosynthesis protein, partial [Candidatus Omnitrophota bacterium]|nr:glucan biosynthesis protein [Candidatus Omnitrophota bacterium]
MAGKKLTSRLGIGIFLKINTVLILGAFLLFYGTLSDAKEKPGRFFKTIIGQAEQLAQEPFQDPLVHKLPPSLDTMGYNQWRDIRFKPEAALWKDSETPFQIQFFHMGFLFKWPVKVNIIDHKRIQAVPFSPQLFHYDKSEIQEEDLQGLSFSGFRVHYPLNKPDYWDEVVSFLGASYFRGLPKDLVYGISARGLAVDTGLPSGEEFPYFKEFWIKRPPKGKDTLVIYGLLDSPSVTGAYQFTLQPGSETNITVHCVLFARHSIEKLCLAPLTSMYYFGENQSQPDRKDFRPEVHDSDGLLIQTESGEWTWRPFINPKRLHIDTFNADNACGFAVLQRDTNFDHYQDLETRSDLRPSVWVQPLNKWGKGHVELLQIPTTNE